MFSNVGMLGSEQHRAACCSDFEDSSSKGIKMLHDVVNPPDQRLSLDEIPSPISSQLFEFCDPELFQSETLTNSEVASSNNCCYDENSINPDLINNNNNMSIIFDSQQDENDNDISASIDFSPSSPFSVPAYINNTNNTTFDLSSDIIVNGLCQYQVHDPVVPIMGNHLLAPVFEEDCLSSVPSFLRINNNNNSFIDLNMTSYFSNLSGGGTNQFCGEYPVICGSEMQQHELEYQGDNGGIYFPDSMQRLLNSGELQALNTENQQIVNGGGSCTAAPLSSEISSLEESSFKVGKLSVEQRKEKIHRYMKKRNERNFSKKIKYACRKTLADSRPRVRGRFAKNDEFGDNHRQNSGNHDEDDDEDLIRVKEEDDMVDSSDIFAHISGVNSFKCNYYIQSWI